MPTPALQTDDTVGAWSIEHQVAAGGQADVYRVHRTDLPLLVGALKLARDAASDAAVAREADVLASFDHDGLVRLLDEGQHEGRHFVVSSWVEGRPLDAVEPLRPRQAATLVARIAEVVSHLHSSGFAHGDLKPANVRVDDRGRLTLLDLGAAVPAETPRPEAFTPRYAPPEWFGSHGADPRAADVYALGVVLFELTTGTEAFSALDGRTLARTKRAGPLLDTLGDDAELSALIATCTAVDPQARPTVTQALNALLAVAEPLPKELHSRTLAPQAGSSAELVPDQQRYTLVATLGQGGMGVVQKLWDARLGRYVALKRPPPGQVDEARFVREAKLLAAMDHPHIVRVLDIGRDGLGLYFTMACKEGGSLQGAVAHKPLPPKEAAELVASVADAVHHAHQAGVLHRDVKPSNILLNLGGRAFLADFGLARPLEDSAHLTVGNGALGTPAYMAPEQLRDDPLTPAVDVFGLGGVLFHLLTGQPPRPEHPPAESLWRISELPIPAARSVDASIPVELDAITAWAVDADPQRRPSAAELAADLRRYLAGEEVHARPLPLPVRAARAVSRNRGSLLRAGATLGMVGLLGGAVWAGQLALAQRAGGARDQQAQERWERLRPQLSADSPQVDPDPRLLAFIEHEDTRGTPAEVDAWMWEAERQVAGEHHEDALTSLAQAWLASRGSADERVLEALSEQLQVAGRWEAAARLAQVEGLQKAESVAVSSAFLQRNFESAAKTDDPRAGLARALQAATRTEVIAPMRMTIGGQAGSVQLVAMGSGPDITQRTLLSASPSLAAVHTWHTTHPATLHLPLGDDAILEAGRSTRHLQLGESGWEERGTLANWNVRQAISDPDHPGSWLLVQSAPGKRIGHWKPGTQPVDLWTPINHIPGEPEGLAAADLDGDGRHEILVNPGHWGAFELWALARTPDSAAGPLRPLSHLRPGYTPMLGVVRQKGAPSLVAYGIDTTYGSRVAFPEGSPYGDALGVHVVGLEDEEWRSKLHVPSAQSSEALFTGDLDGDGNDEVIQAQSRPAVGGGRSPLTLIATPGQDRPIRLIGLRPLAVADLDGDGDDELVVHDQVSDAVWTLGAGDQRLPIRPPISASPAIATGVDPRAEQLAAIGLRTPAARSLAALADGREASEAARMRLQAAEWLLDADRVSEAARLLDQVAPEKAANLLGDRWMLAGEPSPEEPHWSNRFEAATLPAEVSIPSLYQARLGEEGLGLHLVDREEDALQLALAPSDALRVQVDLTLAEADWSAGGKLSLLRESGTRAVEFSFAAIGGAQFTHLELRCIFDERASYARIPVQELPMPVRVVLAREGDLWRCGWEREGHPVHRIERRLGDRAPEPLVLRVTGGTFAGQHTAALEVDVHEIDIRGAEVGATRDRAGARLLTERQPDALLAQGDLDPLAQLLALEESGRTDEAVELLNSILEEGVPGWLPGVLRARDPRWDRALSTRLGADWLTLFDRTWGARLRTGPPSPRNDALLRRASDSNAPIPGDADGVASQHVARAGAWRRAGELARARRELLLAEELHTSPGWTQAVLRARVWVEVDAGQPDAARAALRELADLVEPVQRLQAWLDRHPELQELSIVIVP